ncbi:MAG: SDR family oxidoreductase [Actinobacteria bacterium]|nr:SDR family oxidoreductase [Actinomycetota bacterium]
MAVDHDYLGSLFGLEGKRALVTGGSSGIGAAAARALGHAGAEVVVVGRNQERAEAVAGEIEADGGTAAVEIADLGDPARTEELAAEIIDRHGDVHILFNSAGIFEREAGQDTPLELWERALALNATATFLMCRAVGKGMLARGSGKIVNVASTDGIVGVPEQVAYCASKGAVVQLTKTLGAEWASKGVHVNAVGPCDFDTPMIAGALDEQEYKDWILEAIPAGRIGVPSEIEGAVVYLASPASDMVFGHILMVDGGRVAI